MEAAKATTLNEGVQFSALEMLHCGAELLNDRVLFNAATGDTVNKLGVASLFAGVEQLLKFRLQQTHWSLVFSDVNKASSQGYASGDFTSVSFAELVQRVRGIAGAHLSAEDVDAFDKLRRIRNRGMHYNDNLGTEALAPLYSRVLSAAIDFASTQIDSQALGYKELNKLEVLRRDLADYSGFASHRLNQFNATLERSGIGAEVVPCPTCRQDTLLLGDDIQCGFCGVRFQPDEASMNYEVTQAVWGLSLLREKPDNCPRCSKDHLFEQFHRWICFTCKMTWDKSNYSMCENCTRIVDKDDMDEERSICRRCMGP